MPPTTHEKAHMWQATMGTTHTRRSPMGTVPDQGVRSPRYPSTMPKSLRHPKDKVCWPGPFLLFCLVPSGEDLVLSARWYSCPRMPISYGWCPQTQAGSLVKSVHHDHATIFARLLSPLHCVSLTSDILCSRWFDARAGGGHFSIRYFPPSGNERGGDFQLRKSSC